MKCRQILRRSGAALMAAVLLSMSGLPAKADRKSELEQQIAALQQQEKEIKGQLADAKEDRDASQQRKNLIDSQIRNVEEQIRLLNSQLNSFQSKIGAAEEKIAQAETSIAEKEASIQDTKEKLNQRLRAIMKSGNATTLQMLMNTDSYTDYLLKSKAIQCIAQKDQATIDELEEVLQTIREQKQTLEEEKASLQLQQEELKQLKSTVNQKKKDLDTLCAAAQTELRNLQNTVAGYDEQLKENQRQMEQANRDIAALINGTASNGKYNGGMMFWPVPTVRALSDVFGPRWGTMHRGIDIANGPIPIYGENIVAAANGTVIASNYTNRWGSGWSAGYGYACLVDHGLDSKGRRITTLYAHCSAMYARVGQKVVGGQTVLGQAGQTGNVTGPHLHFEVRRDGTAVDPIKEGYVSPNVN